ncbi:dual specificity phosphatase [Podospora aff. communis PSN243]|uniref:protein-tyrosine-phosphatase n=1 Tax=Podospora aff. communis PSN243 TaxID=3040156 RepID=A0AAV9G9F0_9PEZI|nr:dual specificity phosphatase [Podospora aff. communis PSN243]
MSTIPNPISNEEQEADDPESRFVDITRIIPGLYLGNITASYHLPTLQQHNITALVSIIETPHPRWTTPQFHSQIPPSDNPQDTHHLIIPAFDSPTQDLLLHFQTICDFIDAHLSAERNVLVHCVAGVSRSPTAVTAYLMRKWGKGVDKTLAYVIGKRKCVRPSGNFLGQLGVWEEVGWEVWEGEDGDGGRKAKGAYRDFVLRLKGRGGGGMGVEGGKRMEGGKRRGRR